MRRIIVSLAVLAFAVIVPSSALSHVERNSYWPDPAPDTSVKPAAGGKVPKVRSLSSALRKKPRGKTRVVCRRDSLKRAYRSIRSARTKGYRVRPTLPLKKLSLKQARSLRRLNKAFKKRCKYGNIQTAVFRSRNNDRIVVMPGRYSEGKSRRKPTNDPRCEKYQEQSDKGAGAASYRYQASCPNDQSRGPHGKGRTLPDDSAYNVIDGRCKQYYARGFLLYEMYTRAAAFQSFTRGG